MSVFSLFQALRKWVRRERELGTRKVGGAGKRKKFPVFVPVFPRFIFVFALSSIQRTRQSRSMEQAQSPWWVELKMYGTKQTDRNNYEVSVTVFVR